MYLNIYLKHIIIEFINKIIDELSNNSMNNFIIFTIQETI